jgi:hypothetical protein
LALPRTIWFDAVICELYPIAVEYVADGKALASANRPTNVLFEPEVVFNPAESPIAVLPSPVTALRLL